MKTGMVLGLIGGVIGLLVGAMGFAVANAGNAVAGLGGAEGYFNFYKYVAIIAPIVALLGAGMVPRQPQIGAALMVVASVLMLFAFGLNMLSLIVVGLVGVGAALVFMDQQPTPYQNHNNNTKV